MKKVIPFSSERETNPTPSTTPLAPRGASVAPDLGRVTTTAEQHLLLLHRLIGCTDTTAIVERFHRWTADLDLADGLQFTPVDGEGAIALGVKRHHSAQYVLTLDGKPLGTVRLCRRERFTEDELMTIEQALGSVTRALHSAAEVDSLRELCTRDPLTGLGNRTSLYESMQREVSRARRHGSPLAVMMIDIDHFKTINDELGHLGGDDVLRAIARALRDSTRRSDLLFRFGGDEFTIVLPHTDPAGAEEAARQIRLQLAEIRSEEFGLEASDTTRRPDISVGIASYQEGDDDETLLQRADTHLYHAKARGRARVCSHV
jgi:diguanylate cyclase (GGDEF)-like protein